MDDLIKTYIDLVIRHGEAIDREDFERANELLKEMLKVSIKNTNIEQFIPLLKHNNPYVRVMAANRVYPLVPELAIKVLQEVKETNNSFVGRHAGRLLEKFSGSANQLTSTLQESPSPQLNPKLKQLLIEIHELNARHSKSYIKDIESNGLPSIVWREFSLNDKEEKALRNASKKPEVLSAFRKIMMDHTLSVFHDFFAVLDGVSEPSSVTDGSEETWTGFLLTEQKEDADLPFLHDELYYAYWDWKETQGE